MSKTTKFNCTQQKTSDKINTGIAEHDNYKTWIEWERKNNPNFKEEIHPEMPKPSNYK